MKQIAFLALGAIPIAVGIASIQAASVSYDPSLGSLPDVQGFTRIDTLGHPATTVTGRVLHQLLRSGAAHSSGKIQRFRFIF